MPKLTTELDTAVTLEPELSPELHARLEGSVLMHATLKDMIDTERATMQAILEEAGVSKAAVDGYTVSITSGGTSASLDKKKLVALGCTEAMIAMATTRKPKKSYLTVRKAGEKHDDDE